MIEWAQLIHDLVPSAEKIPLHVFWQRSGDAGARAGARLYRPWSKYCGWRVTSSGWPMRRRGCAHPTIRCTSLLGIHVTPVKWSSCPGGLARVERELTLPEDVKRIFSADGHEVVKSAAPIRSSPDDHCRSADLGRSPRARRRSTSGCACPTSMAPLPMP